MASNVRRPFQLVFLGQTRPPPFALMTGGAALAVTLVESSPATKARACDEMEPMVEPPVMHLVRTGSPLRTAGPRYPESVKPRTGRYLFGPFHIAIGEESMDTTTLLIIIIVILLLGGGWYGRGRWY